MRVCRVGLIAASDFVIVYLIYIYTTGINGQAMAVLGGALALLAAQMTVMPMEIVVALQLTTIPIFSASKVPQIAKAYQEKSTGQLDLFMVALQTLGSLVRVFTSMQQKEVDAMYLAGYVIGASLNGIILLQILVRLHAYRSSSIITRDRYTAVAQQRRASRRP